MNDVMPDIYVDHNAGIHDDSIIPVNRLNIAGADKSTHSVLSTNIESDNYVPIDGIQFKHTWGLPTIININARSLNAEKVDELQVIVDDYDIDVACITETWFREYMDDTSLALEGFCLERKDRDHRRGGGVACYIRNDIEYNRLWELEDDYVRCSMD